MGQLVKPDSVVTHVKDGRVDVCISLELTINVNQNGSIQVSATQKPDTAPKKIEEKDLWMIPDFSDNPKINFGKKVED
jgi:hypothetical protein